MTTSDVETAPTYLLLTSMPLRFLEEIADRHEFAQFTVIWHESNRELEECWGTARAANFLALWAPKWVQKHSFPLSFTNFGRPTG